jgi:hypothetical protein
MDKSSVSGEWVVPGFENQRFRIDGGDGDQDLFGEILILQRVTASWFRNRIGEFYGEAWLVRVIEGPRAGLLLALTPRTIGKIDDAIASFGWKSVIVHGIDYPGYDLEAYGPRSIVGGMTFIERELGSE